MERAENEQTAVDLFWGLDKEASDCSRERILMEKEFERSTQHEYYYQTSIMRSRWEEEDRDLNYHKACEAATKENQARKQYLKSFYNAESSAEIIYFDWPTAPRATTPSRSTKNKKSVEDLVGNLLQHSDSDFELVNLNEDGSTIHLGGLQQSRAIAAVYSSATISAFDQDEDRSPMVRSRSHATIAELAMRPLVLNKSRAAMRNRALRFSKPPESSSRRLLSSSFPTLPLQSMDDSPATNAFRSSSRGGSPSGLQSSTYSGFISTRCKL